MDKEYRSLIIFKNPYMCPFCKNNLKLYIDETAEVIYDLDDDGFELYDPDFTIVEQVNRELYCDKCGRSFPVYGEEYPDGSFRRFFHEESHKVYQEKLKNKQ